MQGCVLTTHVATQGTTYSYPSFLAAADGGLSLVGNSCKVRLQADLPRNEPCWGLYKIRRIVSWQRYTQDWAREYNATEEVYIC